LQRVLVEELPRSPAGTIDAAYAQRFLETINDDLDTPGAIALAWQLVKNDAIQAADKRATLLHFDGVLGIGLRELAKSGTQTVSLQVVPVTELPVDVQTLIKERDAARANKDWAKADALRDDLQTRGYQIEDAADGARVTKTD